MRLVLRTLCNASARKERKRTRTSNSNSSGTKRKSLEYIRASSNPSVGVHFALLEDLGLVLSNLQQDLQRRRGPLELPSSVIRAENCLDTRFGA